MPQEFEPKTISTREMVGSQVGIQNRRQKEFRTEESLRAKKIRELIGQQAGGLTGEQQNRFIVCENLVGRFMDYKYYDPIKNAIMGGIAFLDDYSPEFITKDNNHTDFSEMPEDWFYYGEKISRELEARLLNKA